MRSRPTIEPRLGGVVCLLLAGKRWIVGWNSPKTSPALQRSIGDGKSEKATRHAEAHALQLARRAGGKIRAVYVLRWTKQGRLTMARPCPHCSELLWKAGVPARIVHYSDWEGKMRNMAEKP